MNKDSKDIIDGFFYDNESERNLIFVLNDY